MEKLIGQFIDKRIVVECKAEDVDSVVEYYAGKGVDLEPYQQWVEKEAERLLEPREED